METFLMYSGYIFSFIIIIGVVFIIYTIIKKQTIRAGNLRIDKSDPDGPYMFLELEMPLEKLEKCKDINLKIINKNYKSQK